jgi:hypothetical protein
MVDIKKRRGRKRKCDSTLNSAQIDSAVDLSSCQPVDTKKSGTTFNFGGMQINVEEEVVEEETNVDEKSSEIDLCDIDIPDRIVVKHSRKPRKKIIEDSDRIYRVLNETLGKFNLKDDYPTSSDFLCWWCCHNFDESPKCVPTSYNSKTDSFKITGNFCSWNCAKAYTIYEKPSQITNLTRLVQFIYGSGDFSIPVAPPRYLLKSFGGTLSIDEFRENVSTFELNKPNMMFDEKLFYVKTN